MTQFELLMQLRLLTGDLTAGEAGPDDLHSLRRRLAASLHSVPVQATQQAALGTADECLEPRLLAAIAESTQELVPEGSSLTLVRCQTPLASPLLAAGSASQFAGQSPTRVFGLFVDALQRPVWFDEFLVGPVL